MFPTSLGATKGYTAKFLHWHKQVAPYPAREMEQRQTISKGDAVYVWYGEGMVRCKVEKVYSGCFNFSVKVASENPEHGHAKLRSMSPFLLGVGEEALFRGEPGFAPDGQSASKLKWSVNCWDHCGILHLNDKVWTYVTWMNENWMSSSKIITKYLGEDASDMESVSKLLLFKIVLIVFVFQIDEKSLSSSGSKAECLIRLAEELEIDFSDERRVTFVLKNMDIGCVERFDMAVIARYFKMEKRMEKMKN